MTGAVYVTDYLQFEGGAVETTYRVGWTGPWPPPERMLAVKGHATGEIRIADPNEIDAAVLKALVEHPTTAVTLYRLESWSKLPPQGEGSHLARGARYVVEEELAVVLRTDQP